jgi:hypothetical protein
MGHLYLGKPTTLFQPDGNPPAGAYGAVDEPRERESPILFDDDKLNRCEGFPVSRPETESEEEAI